MTLADRAAQPDATERVLDAVAAIPRGQVRSYGQVGATTGVGAHQVGRILAVLGEQVPWWRVVHADGSITTTLLEEAQRLLAQEGVELAPGGVARRAVGERTLY